MEAQRLASHPHCLTPPGTVISLPHRGDSFTALAGWVAYQDNKPRNAYFLRDETGELWACLNAWLTPYRWIGERKAQLERGQRELVEMVEAVRGGLM